MTERGALLAASGMHVALVVVLSLGISQVLPTLDVAPDVTPIEYMEIGPEPTATKMPQSSMEAAPRDPGPPPASMVPETPMPQAPAPPVVTPVPAPDDRAPQDAIAEEARRAPPPRAAPSRAKNSFDPGAMAALIDKSIPDAPVRPRDTSAFAKSIEQAIPKGARISPRQVATLEQAIRAQIAPCWNPPIGGADVAEMTVVLKIRLNGDGSVAAPPEFVSQTGASAGNQAYARAFVETARRAVLRCTPLDLPADLFAHWREFELNFDPRLMT